MQVVVLMGGLGTRLGDITASCPKPLLEIHGKPFFEYQLELLTEAGFREFLFCVGYRATMIEEYFGDGSNWGVDIRYCYDGERLLGTGGAVVNALPYIHDDFMLIYGDSFMDIDYFKVLHFYHLGKHSGKDALMTVFHNDGEFDKSNVIMRDGEIVLYDKVNTTPDMDYIDYGVSVFRKRVFDGIPADEPMDLSTVQTRLTREERMTACEVKRRFYEIGSPSALQEFASYVQDRFYTEHPAVFLDRDGVIDELVFDEDTEHLDSPHDWSEFRFVEGAPEALRLIKDLGYYIFIVSNQPAAAKGKTTLKALYEINENLVDAVKDGSVVIDEVFICPHHPVGTEYARERWLIKDCDCRKPKPGLLGKAFGKYAIDSSASFMVGDSYTDILAGQAMGLKTVLIGELKCDFCKFLDNKRPDICCADLEAFADYLKEN